MEPPDHLAAVILAAGESRRFGSPKQLAQLDGRTLLEHVIDAAAAAGLTPIVAVVPPWLPHPGTMDEHQLRWVPNSHPERGMSHSLQLAFTTLNGMVKAAVILLGDQPTVPMATIAALLVARGERPMVATLSDGHLGPPVLIERSHFDVVQETSGDNGLREVLNSHPELVAKVEVEERIADVDTMDDLRALQSRA